MKQLLTLFLIFICSICNAQNYEIQWKDVYQSELNKHYKTASNQVDKIYHKAVSENNSREIVKTFFYRNKLKGYIEITDSNDIFNDIDKEIKNLNQPYKSILQTYKAQLLTEYFSKNEYLIIELDKVKESYSKSNIENWRSIDFINEINNLYLEVFKNEELLKNSNDFLGELVQKDKLSEIKNYNPYELICFEWISIFEQNAFTNNAISTVVTLKASEVLDFTTNFTTYKFPRPFSNVFNLYQDLELYYEKEHDFLKLDQVKLKRYKNFSEALNLSFDIKDQLLSNIFDAVKTRKFKSKVIVEKVNLWYNYGLKNRKGNTSLTAKIAWAKTAEYILSLKDFELTEAESIYIKDVYNTITDKKTQTNLPKYFLKNTVDKGFIRFANTDTLFTKFYKIDNIQMANSLKNDSLKKDYVLKHVPLYEKVTTSLNKEADHFEKQYEFLINGLPKGNYLALTSATKEFNSKQKYYDFHHVIVTDVVLFYKAEANTIDFYFLDRKTGKAFVNQKVKINSEKYKTNKFGVVSVKKSKKVTKKEYVKKADFLVQFQDDDFLFEEVCNFDKEELVYNYQNKDNRYEDEEEEVMFNIYTDRKLYRPSQTIYFKGILATIDHIKQIKKVVPNTRLHIIATDDNGVELYKKDFVTNAYGSVADSIKIPKKANISKINVVYEPPTDLTKEEKLFWKKYTDTSGGTTLYVEEYKRPTFSVAVNNFKENVSYGEEVVLTGNVLSYAKAPISNAKIEAKIYLSEYAYQQNSYYLSKTFPIIETTTNAAGNFSVKFRLKPIPKDSLVYQPNQDYRIEITVKDASGEAQTTYTDLKVNHNDLILNFPEYNKKFKLDSNFEIYLKSTNANGSFKPVSGTLKISRNEKHQSYQKSRLWQAPAEQNIPIEEFKKYFPFEKYTSNKEDVEIEVYSKKINITEDIPFIIEKPDWFLAGSYNVEFIADDAFKTEKIHSSFHVENPNALPEDNQVVELSFGENSIKNNELTLKVNAVFNDVLVFVQVQQNYDILPTTTFVSKKGLSEIKLQLKDQHTNQIFAKYYYVYDNRAYENLIENEYLERNVKKVKTEVIHLKNRLLPNAKEQILLKITNDDQKPFDGEMLASMHDISAENMLNNHHDSNIWNFYTGYFSYSNALSELYYDTDINGKSFSYYNWNTILDPKLLLNYPQINKFGYSLYDDYYVKQRYYNSIKSSIIFTEPEKGLMQLYGSVYTQDGDPIPGATVMIEGSNQGTDTDDEGNFIIFVSPQDVLKVVYAGFKPVKFIAEDFKGRIVLMEDENLFLSEVVVDTYRTLAAPTLNDLRQIYDSAINTDTQNIQAIINETIVEFNFSEKDNSTKVVLRGVAGVKNTAEPLYVVDGIPVSAEFFRTLGYNDINNISVLKDSGATAIYGNRGANGVILISTKKGDISDMMDVKIRKNLKETAFFKPFIYLNKNNLYEINYTVPESLTEWKFRALTHNTNAEVSYLETSIFTQKNVTIQPNMPRFLREGDEAVLRARVSNVSNGVQNGKVLIQLQNALTNENLDKVILSENLQDIQIQPNSSTFVEWKVNIPENIQGLQYVVSIKTAEYSDGEQAIIPILSKKQFVSENLSVWQLGNTTKKYQLSELDNDASKTNLNYSIQLSSSDLWFVLNKLPYLLSYPHECTEQLASKYFANQLALKILGENKDIKTIFQDWNSGDNKKWDNDVRLKEIIENESPWLQELLSNKERKQKLASYFNEDLLQKSSNDLIKKIISRQNENGGFGWFSKENDDFWITLQVLQTFKQLNELNINWNQADYQEKINSAIFYLDTILLKEKDIKSVSIEKWVDYMYLRTYFKPQFPISNNLVEKWNNILNIIENNWLKVDLSIKSKAATIFKNEGKVDLASNIIKQLNESAIVDESLGMYWKTTKTATSFWDTPTEQQSYVIEAFKKNDEDHTKLQSLKSRLLNQSSYDSFGSTKATVNGLYAYLLGNEKVYKKSTVQISDKQNKKLVTENTNLDAYGIYEINFSKDAINSSLQEITVENTGETPVVGSINYNYLQDIDKVTKTNNNDQPFVIKKDYFKEINNQKVLTDNSQDLKIGDEVWVRINFYTKENASYVHIKDERAATFEPFFELSGIKYENDFRYFYKVNDASTNFFIDYLPIGEYDLWYKVKVNNAGTFIDGLTTMQSMYAPQYNAHSSANRLIVN